MYLVNRITQSPHRVDVTDNVTCIETLAHQRVPNLYHTVTPKDAIDRQQSIHASDTLALTPDTVTVNVL